MSGAELIAIIGCVAGLIQAYEAASKIVSTIKRKRRERLAPPPSEFLEDAIEEGKRDVQRLLDKGQRRFGPAFQYASDGGTADRHILSSLTLRRCNHLVAIQDDYRDPKCITQVLRTIFGRRRHQRLRGGGVRVGT